MEETPTPSDFPIFGKIISSYRGKPADNTRKFIDWIEKIKERPLSRAFYACFGCRNRHWKYMIQRIAKTSDTGLERAGVRRFVDRGVADARKDSVLDDVENWEDEKCRSDVKTSFGGVNNPAPDRAPTSDLAISHLLTTHGSCHKVRKTCVLESKTAASSNGSQKRDVDLQLPAGTTYGAGDYLAMLPKNPRQNIERVVRKFNLPWDGSFHIRSNDTFLPSGTPLGISEVLRSHVEISHPATHRDIKILIHHTIDSATRMSLTSMSGEYFSSHIAARNTSILDLLETYPAIDLSFETYLALLPSLRPRQYSFPLTDPSVCTITYSVLDAENVT